LLLSRAQAWIHKINSTEPPTYELLSAEAALSYKIGQLQLAFNLIQDAKKLAWQQEMDTEFIDELEILVKESASSKGIKLKNPKSK
jgi:hypothetical protein